MKVLKIAPSLTLTLTFAALAFAAQLLPAADTDPAAQNAVQPATDAEALENYYADLVLDSLDGRTWLLTAGPLDAALGRRAAARGLPLVLLPIGAKGDTAGGKAWADRVAAREWKDPERIRISTMFGPVVFARQWLATDPEGAAADLAVMEFPDILYAGTLRAKPQGLVFIASRETPETQASDDAIGRNRALFENVAARLNTTRNASPALADARRYLRRQAARAANDFGVQLLRAGRTADAHDFFEKAREMDPENISALLNQIQCVRQGVRPETREALGRALESWRENGFDAERLWGLTQVFGQVDAVGDLLAASWFWTLSGIPGAETDRWRAALAKVPEENRPGVERLLARTHVLQRGNTDASMDVVDGLCDPARRARACLLLARVHCDRREADAAGQWLDEARKAGAPEDEVRAEAIRQTHAAGRAAEARADAERAVAEHPDSVPLLLLHAVYACETRDAGKLEAAIPRLRELEAPDGKVLALEAQLALFRAKPREARELLLKAIGKDPDTAENYDRVLALDLALDDLESGEAHARAVLRKSTGHVLANYVMGSVLSGRREWDRAEEHFRRCLRCDPKFVPALNDYAMVLVETGRAAEAERAVREALRNGTGKGDAAMWDTLALACEAQGRFDEAHAAFAEAVRSLGPKTNVEILLHWARSLKRKGDADAAAKVLKRLQGAGVALTPEQKAEFDRLR